MNRTCKICKVNFYNPHPFQVCGDCLSKGEDMAIGDDHKFDGGKLRFDLIPPEITRELAKVLTYGANKYRDNGWKDVEPSRYIAALFRHLNSHRSGEEVDEESGLNHLSHALTNVAFLLYFDLQNKKSDSSSICLTQKELDDMLEDMELEHRKSNYFDDSGNTNNI